MTAQIRRGCASIPANIAEGCGRGSDADFARFLQMAMGSSSEVEYHLLLARDPGFLESESYGSLSDRVREIKRMLASLISRLRTNGRAIESISDAEN